MRFRLCPVLLLCLCLVPLAVHADAVVKIMPLGDSITRGDPGADTLVSELPLLPRRVPSDLGVRRGLRRLDLVGVCRVRLRPAARRARRVHDRHDGRHLVLLACSRPGSRRPRRRRSCCSTSARTTRSTASRSRPASRTSSRSSRSCDRRTRRSGSWWRRSSPPATRPVTRSRSRLQRGTPGARGGSLDRLLARDRRRPLCRVRRRRRQPARRHPPEDDGRAEDGGGMAAGARADPLRDPDTDHQTPDIRTDDGRNHSTAVWPIHTRNARGGELQPRRRGRRVPRCDTDEPGRRLPERRRRYRSNQRWRVRHRLCPRRRMAPGHGECRVGWEGRSHLPGRIVGHGLPRDRGPGQRQPRCHGPGPGDRRI